MTSSPSTASWWTESAEASPARARCASPSPRAGACRAARAVAQRVGQAQVEEVGDVLHAHAADEPAHGGIAPRGLEIEHVLADQVHDAGAGLVREPQRREPRVGELRAQLGVAVERALARALDPRAGFPISWSSAAQRTSGFSGDAASQE
jgi:hypothetical protein